MNRGAQLLPAQIEALHDTAQLRIESYGVRVANAALIASIGIGITHRVDLFLGWLCLVLAMQTLDRLMAKQLLLRPPESLFDTDVAAFSCWTFCNVACFAFASVLYWVVGGAAGIVTAVLLLCAGLLHVSLTTYLVRPLLIASVAPYLLFLSGLALVYGPISGAYSWPQTIAVLAAMVGFFSNFRKGADLLDATLARLRSALAEADEQRASAEARRREADQANDAKSRFLANMSHELRTPLNAIIGFNELLCENAVDDGRAADVKDHQRITASAERLLRQINELLDITKIESGRMLFDLRAYNPADLAREVADTVRPLIEANSNRFELIVAPDLGAALGDPFRISQGILNLLSNAAKFTKGGLVRLEVRRSGEAIDFIVTDTGCGIAPERIGYLFQPFIQADATIARNHGGSGLGLALTRRIARALGGDAWAHSERDIGSTFTMRVAATVNQPAYAIAA